MTEKTELHQIVVDAYAPARMAAMVERSGVVKTTLPMLSTLTLGFLAGVFIAFGAMLFTVVTTNSDMGFGPGQWLGGIAFSLGLVLVVIAGAELFTGNNLSVMAWAAGKITLRQLLKNWVLVYGTNFVGAVVAAAVFWRTGLFELDGGNLGARVIAIANAKVQLSFEEAFFRGVLCNALVCLGVWLSFAAHSVSGKIMAVVFPISAFVALGFEHSIANMYFIPLGWLAGAEDVNFTALMGNLIPVTLGNILGGAGFVALIYWLVYLRKVKEPI